MSKVYGALLMLLACCPASLSGQMGFAYPSTRQRISPFGQTAFHPVISTDGTALYMTVRGHPANIGLANQDDIWVAYLSDSSRWARPIHAGLPLNDERSNQAMALALDGNTMYGWTRDGGEVSILGFAERQGRSWQQPEAMYIEGWDTIAVAIRHWQVNRREDVLLLAAALPGTNSDTDLFFSVRKDATHWSHPKRLEGHLNSPFQETSVHLAPDNKTLYFSSDRPGGWGGQDLYVCQRLDDSWSHWSNPVNLGAPINSEQDEAGACTSKTGETLYFTVGSGTESAIYEAVLRPELQPERMLLCTGQVRHALSGEPLSASVCLSISDQGTSHTQRCGIQTDAAGRVSLLVPQMQDVLVYAQKSSFFSTAQLLSALGDPREQKDQEPDFLAEVTRREPTYRQRDEDIQAVQSRLHTLDRSIAEMEKLRTAELLRIAALPDSFGWRTSVPFPKDLIPTHLRSSYDATREQYYQSWSIPEPLDRGDVDPGDSFYLAESPREKPLTPTAEGRIKELYERRKWKNEQEKQNLGSSSPVSASLLNVTPSSFEDFVADIQGYIAHTIQDSLLNTLEREVFPQTIIALRGSFSEAELDDFQEVVQQIVREKQSAGRSGLLHAPDHLVYAPLRQPWQEPFADTLQRCLSQSVASTLRTRLVNPVRAFLEYDILQRIYQKRMETQQAFLDQLIQKQVQVEKSYRKRSFPLNTLSEMQEDTLVVHGNQHTQFDLWLYPAGKSLQFQLGNVSFPSNEAEIPESSLAELQRLARFLRENPDMHAQMDVYTQGPCSYGFALELTRDRAACIEGFLVYQEGVPADRISVRGRGKEVPPSSADDAEKQRGSQHIALTFTTKRQ